MLNRAALVGLCGMVLCAGLASGCAGGSKSSEAPASEKPAAEAPPAPAAQAANDPAASQAPDAGEMAYDPATAAGAVKGTPAPTNTAPIEAVANFFTELPGFDLAALDTHKREKMLHRVNSELCTCGCKNDTLARCLVNDPKCPTVKAQIQAVYDEVKSGH